MSRHCGRIATPVLLAVLASGLGVIACERSPDPESAAWIVHERLLADTNGLPFQGEIQRQSKEEIRWDFFDPEELAHWTVEGSDREPTTEGRTLTLAPRRRFIGLTRRVDLHTDEIDLIRLHLEEATWGTQFWFRWAGPDEKFTDERMIHVPPFSRSTPNVIHFDLSAHPEWQGPVRRIRLGIGTGHGKVVRVESLLGLAFTAEQQPNPSSASRAGWTTLDSELRAAYLTTPARPIRWTVEVPENARLRFGFGLQSIASATSELAVVAVTQKGEPLTLFSHRASTGDRDRWRDHTVDLSPLAGQRAELRFGITASDAESRRSRAEILWSNLEILVPTREAPPNLVLVVVDTLRADRLSLYGNSRKTSPVLDSWAAHNGIVFESVVAAAPWTLPSHVSLLSGLDAHRHGVNFDTRIPDSMPLLAEILRAAGYTTLAVTGGGYLHPRFGFQQGFDAYRTWTDRAGAEDDLEVASHMDRALNLIDEYGERPFFLFFHTYEVHEPYDERQPFYTEFGGASDPPEVRLDHHRMAGIEAGFVGSRRLGIVTDDDPPSWEPLPEELASLPVDLYDSSIALVDQQLGRLWRRLQGLPSTRPTMVIFTSDHGEMLGEHDLAGHASLYDETLLIPLVMALPGREHSGSRIAEPVRSIDIMPTILAGLGLPVPEGLDGRSLMPQITGKTETFQTQAPLAWSYASKPNLGLAVRRDDDLKLLLNHTVWEPARGQARLFQVSADPEEARDLARERPAETAALVQAVSEILAQQLPGLRIRLHNATGAAISGELVGPSVEAFRVKSLDLPCDCIEWLEQGRIRFEVPAGVTYSLILESAPAHPLTVRLDPAGNPDFEIALDELTGVRTLTRSSAGWAWSASREEPQPAVLSFWWQGGPAGSGLALEPELAAQLEALGYLQ